MKPDKKIWDDFRKGENYALSHIYFQHVQMLYRYGKKFSNNDELIKDTIQDLFFDLIRTRKNLSETDNIGFYLMASFRRKLAKSINKKIPLEYSGDQELTAEIVYSAEHDLIGREELSQREKAVKKALAEPSPKQREILYYKFTCNFDYDQICEIMKLQYDSARKQVSRALKAMKEILSGSELYLFFVGMFSDKKDSSADSAK
ncbi:MAG: RNA polymerase sigma factor [Mariniphaga sp.]